MRKAIDERDKAEKVMQSKESTAEKLEKKNDEKAPQGEMNSAWLCLFLCLCFSFSFFPLFALSTTLSLPIARDEAVKATSDFKAQDAQIMERLRAWTQTRGEKFSKVYKEIASCLSAPSNAEGGGGIGSNVSFSVPAVSSSPVRAAEPVQKAAATTTTTTPASTSQRLNVPNPSTLSEDDARSWLRKVQEALVKAQKNHDELEKLAAMYERTKDKEGAGKAQQEALSLQGDIECLQADKERLEERLTSPGGGAASAPVAAASSGGATQKARVLYDFVAERPEELSLTAGDEVTVLDSSETEGWWEGMASDGKTGFFPGSYVQLV